MVALSGGMNGVQCQSIVRDSPSRRRHGISIGRRTSCPSGSAVCLWKTGTHSGARNSSVIVLPSTSARR